MIEFAIAAAETLFYIFMLFNFIYMLLPVLAMAIMVLAITASFIFKEKLSSAMAFIPNPLSRILVFALRNRGRGIKEEAKLRLTEWKDKSGNVKVALYGCLFAIIIASFVMNFAKKDVVMEEYKEKPAVKMDDDSLNSIENESNILKDFFRKNK